MLVSLRETCTDQPEFLFRLYASTRLEELAVLPWDETQKTVFLRMQFQAQKQSYEMAYSGADHKIIFVDNQPAGRILVNCKADEVCLVDIALLPEYRNQGIGSSLIKDWISRCENMGVPFRLQVTQQNTGAFYLYTKLGFKLISEDAMYRQMERQPAHSSSAGQD